MSFPTPTYPLFPIAVSFVKALNARNFDAAEKLLAPAFLHRLFPASIRPTWAAHADRETFLAQATEGYIENFGFEIAQPIDVLEGHDCIIMQLNSHGKLKNGNALHPEYCLIFRFDTATKKILNFDEWVDSAAALKALDFGPAEE